MPFADEVAEDKADALPMTLVDYADLLDWTGRATRHAFADASAVGAQGEEGGSEGGQVGKAASQVGEAEGKRSPRPGSRATQEGEKGDSSQN